MGEPGDSILSNSNLTPPLRRLRTLELELAPSSPDFRPCGLELDPICQTLFSRTRIRIRRPPSDVCVLWNSMSSSPPSPDLRPLEFEFEVELQLKPPSDLSVLSNSSWNSTPPKTSPFFSNSNEPRTSASFQTRTRTVPRCPGYGLLCG